MIGGTWATSHLFAGFETCDVTNPALRPALWNQRLHLKFPLWAMNVKTPVKCRNKHGEAVKQLKEQQQNAFNWRGTLRTGLTCYYSSCWTEIIWNKHLTTGRWFKLVLLEILELQIYYGNMLLCLYMFFGNYSHLLREDVNIQYPSKGFNPLVCNLLPLIKGSKSLASCSCLCSFKDDNILLIGIRRARGWIFLRFNGLEVTEQFYFAPSKWTTFSSPRRNLRRLSDLQEGDWPVLQADPEGAGDQRGPHHHRRLHVPLLLKPGLAQAGADGGHLHRQEGRGARPGAREEPHLSGCGSHLHGLPGLSREEDPERCVTLLSE